MRATITLSPATRDRILELKRKLRLSSAEAVLVQLMGAQPMGAKALYQAHKKEVDAVLRKHKVRKLVAFGSRARGDARPDSDLDLVGDLPVDAGLFAVTHLKDDLQAVVGLPVDFVPLSGLTPRLRREVARDGVDLVG